MIFKNKIYLEFHLQHNIGVRGGADKACEHFYYCENHGFSFQFLLEMRLDTDFFLESADEA